MAENEKGKTREDIEKEAAKITCTMCKKSFTLFDYYHGDNRFDLFMNYGSKYDLKRLKFNFCIECFDKVLDMIIPMCKMNPEVDDDWTEHCVDRHHVIHRNWGPNTSQITKDKETDP